MYGINLILEVYLRRALNYLERVTLSVSTCMLSITTYTTIGVETPRINSGCYLEKKFNELININPYIVFNLTLFMLILVIVLYMIL